MGGDFPIVNIPIRSDCGSGVCGSSIGAQLVWRCNLFTSLVDGVTVIWFSAPTMLEATPQARGLTSHMFSQCLTMMCTPPAPTLIYHVRSEYFPFWGRHFVCILIRYPHDSVAWNSSCFYFHTYNSLFKNTLLGFFLSQENIKQSYNDSLGNQLI